MKSVRTWQGCGARRPVRSVSTLVAGVVLASTPLRAVTVGTPIGAALWSLTLEGAARCGGRQRYGRIRRGLARARRIGIKTVLTPIASPQTNAIAERMLGTLRRECLDHVIVVNERHLRHVLREFVRHYNQARPHQTLELEPPVGSPRAGSVARGCRVVSRSVLGGLTHEYQRVAA